MLVVDRKVDQKLNGTQSKILAIIKNNPNVLLNYICEELKLSIQAIKKKIKFLKDNHYIERVGSNRNGY